MNIFKVIPITSFVLCFPFYLDYYLKAIGHSGFFPLSERDNVMITLLCVNLLAGFGFLIIVKVE